MRCETARERLRECLDGQLPPPVKAHLDGCASCRVEWVWLRQVDDALATLPLSEEPADFTARVMAQVQTAEANRPPVLSPASKLAHILRWEDAVMSFAFAWAIMVLFVALSSLGPQEISTLKGFLQRAWWAWLPELDRMWHTLQTQPLYVVWGASSLCVAAAAALSACVLSQKWPLRKHSNARR
jgi:anti-sigma factor RsiW